MQKKKLSGHELREMFVAATAWAARVSSRQWLKSSPATTPGKYASMATSADTGAVLKWE